MYFFSCKSPPPLGGFPPVTLKCYCHIKCYYNEQMEKRGKPVWAKIFLDVSCSSQRRLEKEQGDTVSAPEALKNKAVSLEFKPFLCSLFIFV